MAVVVLQRLWRPGGVLMAAALAIFPVTASGQDPTPKIGLIGDSLTVATNSDDMCGSGGELPKCIDKRFGGHDLAWSHAGGEASWSIARRLGYNPEQVINAAGDGEEWKDALRQARQITELPGLETVFINMGGNDVCQDFGHNYDGDLEEIEAHIDATLTHLLARLPEGGQIYWSGVPDIVGYRDALVHRRHNYMFKSCQGLWDLDSDEVTVPAAISICKDQAGDFDAICGSATDRKEAREFLVDQLLDYYLDRLGIDEGPCGSVLSSKNGGAERLAARRFNKALNRLLARKAAAYDGVNAVDITFTNALFEVEIEPHYVSRLDCYHPSRAGQMRMAQGLWSAFAPEEESRFAFWYENFGDRDDCNQDFGADWASCWKSGGGPGFKIGVDDRGWLKVQKDADRRARGWAARRVGDLSDMTQAWLSLNHKREKLDDGGDRVYLRVYKDGIWHELDRFKGGGLDAGEHNGKYYDLRPFISDDLRIMFRTSEQGSMRDGDRVKFDNISLFAWDDGGALDPRKLVTAGRSGPRVTDAWRRIKVPEVLPRPVATLAGLETANGEDPAGLRLRALGSDGFGVRVEEEQSFDRETSHLAESVAYAAFAPGYIANSEGRVVGEAGVLSAKQKGRARWHRLDFLGAYRNPVVFMNITSIKDPTPAHVRLNPVTGRALHYLIEEWDYLDGKHGRENLAYMIFEAGIHELAGGGRVEAGSLAVDHRWQDITFAADFAAPPVTLSQSQTRKGASAIVVRQRNVTPEGLEVRVQEEEANGAFHVLETVGYLAIEP